MSFFDNSRSRYDYVVSEYFAERDAEVLKLKRFMEKERYRDVRFEKDKEKEFEKLSPICHECIFNHLNKYDKILEAAGTPQTFTITCKGIPKEYISDKVLRQLDVEPGSVEADGLVATRDIVTWAKLNCITDRGPWIARDYQEGPLRCSAKNMVTRLGRRAGKSDVLVVKALYYAITRPFHKIIKGKKFKRSTSILIITPRQTHADNIIEKIDEFFRNNEDLANSYISYKKSPYVNIKFKNGSRLVVLTAGTGGANAGLSIRSFSADLLILDEANYLGAAELKAANAILTTNRDCLYHVSSTPLGIQDFFWRFCFASPRFKEFYAPTPRIPDWEIMKEDVYATVMTSDDFMHEYMALFSASAQGVFRIDLVQKAVRNYSYFNMKKSFGFEYAIGVDWNSNAGTEIYVTGLDLETGALIGVDSVNVPKSERTQILACERIIDLAIKWNPMAIYVDRGYGEMQIETLKEYSLVNASKHPIIANLKDILKPFDFGGSIEVRDPVTKKINKKEAKPFLVKNAVKRYEEERVNIPVEDNLLIEQLNSYAIKSISPTGRETYHSLKADIGDHRLDAHMLSLVAFTIEKGDLMLRGNGVNQLLQVPSPFKVEGLIRGTEIPSFTRNQLERDPEDKKYTIVNEKKLTDNREEAFITPRKSSGNRKDSLRVIKRANLLDMKNKLFRGRNNGNPTISKRR